MLFVAFNLLKLALAVKAQEKKAYVIAFAPPAAIFFLVVILFLGTSVTAVSAAVLSGVVMGGLAVAAVWLFAESQLNGIFALLEKTPTKKVHSPAEIDRALARVVHVFSEKKLRQLPLRVGESAFYCPQPFIAVMLEPAKEEGGTVVSIACDENDGQARAVTEFMAANLRID